MHKIGCPAVFAAALAVFVFAPAVGRSQSPLLPVVRCATSYGLPRSTSGAQPRIPTRLAAKVAVTRAGRLAFYSDGWLTLLAPRGWHCTGTVGATGALDLSVLPAHVTGVTPGAAGVTAYVPSSESAGEVGAVACPFFPQASRLSPPCPGPVPAGERVLRLNAHAISFQDPPHVPGTGYPSGGAYRASGVVLFNGVTSLRHDHPSPRATQATCTLPRGQHALCAAILTDFLRRYRL